MHLIPKDCCWLYYFPAKTEEVKEIPSKEMKSEAKFYFLKWLEQKLNEIRLIGWKAIFKWKNIHETAEGKKEKS